MASYFNMIIEILKIIYLIMNTWIKWTAEERIRFQERMNAVTDLLKKAVENKSDIINEADYTSNLEWEKKQRYEGYKKEIIFLLSKGSGIQELKADMFMGLGARITVKEVQVIIILKDAYSVEEKAILISKMIVES